MTRPPKHKIADDASAFSDPMPHPASRWVRRIVDALAALFILAFFVPWQPTSEEPIGAFDFSWMLLMHDAIATGRQFGKQIILPQGPLGFLGNSVYDPRTYWILIAAGALAALAAFACLRAVARKYISQPLLALLWMCGIIMLIGYTPDHFFPACATLLVIAYFEVDERRLRPEAIFLIVTLAASSLIKENQPLYALIAIGAIMVDQAALRRRSFLIPGAVYFGSLLIFYVSARQSLWSLGAFLWGWKEVALGHADAVGLPGPAIDPIIYLVIVAMVVGLISYDHWIRRRWRGALLPAAMAATLLLFYKHSFMRFDLWHVHMGPMVLAAIALIYAGILWNRHGRNVRRMACVNAVLAAAFASSILNYTPRRNLVEYGRYVMLQCGDNISAAASAFTDRSRLHREWEAARAKLRQDNPLPLEKITGTVDVYPHRQDIVFAYGLNYHPRPVISSLVATSPTLADVNARHLRGPDAATTILFDIDLVDHNYPTILDGQSLPEILTRYDLIDSTHALLVLRKSPSPRLWRLVQLGHDHCTLGQPVRLPMNPATPIWVRIHLKKSALEPLLGAVYKMACANIHVRTVGGDEEDYRLLPSLAEQGFLLSPLLKDRGLFAKFMGRTWAKELRPNMIEQITVTVEAGSRESAFEPAFNVDWFGLEFERQN